MIPDATCTTPLPMLITFTMVFAVMLSACLSRLFLVAIAGFLAVAFIVGLGGVASVTLPPPPDIDLPFCQLSPLSIALVAGMAILLVIGMAKDSNAYLKAGFILMIFAIMSGVSSVTYAEAVETNGAPLLIVALACSCAVLLFPMDRERK